MGAPVTELKKQNGWYYVKAGAEKYLGWMEVFTSGAPTFGPTTKRRQNARARN